MSQLPEYDLLKNTNLEHTSYNNEIVMDFLVGCGTGAG